MPSDSNDEVNDDEGASRSRRFKFKRKHNSTCVDDEYESFRHRDRSHRRRKRAKPAAETDIQPEHANSTSQLPPDVAFRESLFDALGDDEGASFWQGVYGQPIHNYPNTVPNEDTGELERMSDEEYATFVRRKMWEKSREGIEAAREEKRRQQKAEEQRQADKGFRPSRNKSGNTDFLFDLDVETSLKRGANRREKKRWKSLWMDYILRWEELQSLHDAWKADQISSGQLFLRNKIAWPVQTGKRVDVNNEEVERFIRKCAEFNAETNNSSALSHILKAQRIRFHPDKIQQRYGFMEIDNVTMQGVTAVFQILDRMWNEQRNEPA